MKLKDIADYVTEKISSDAIDLDSYITTDSLLQNKAGREKALNMPPQTCTLTRYKVGDILVANIRPYLKKVWMADIDGGCNADVLVFRAKSNHSANFLYAVLLQDAFYTYAMKGAKGSKMPRGDKDQIMRYEIPMLSSSEESIGNFIVDINAKIAINREINRNLEAMARQLYDYWFVQFDFPDENGRPYKSSGGKMVWNEKLKREIPEGWSSSTIGNIASLNKSSLLKKDDLTELLYLDTSSLTENKIGTLHYLEREAAPSRAQRKVSKNTILYSTVRPRLKHFGILCNPPDNLIASTGFCTIDTNNISYSFWLYLFLTEEKIINNLGDIADTAVSSYPSIGPSDIEGLQVCLGNDELMVLFYEKVSALFEIIESNQNENNELQKQRDELLPLFMNSQVSVMPSAINCDLSHD